MLRTFHCQEAVVVVIFSTEHIQISFALVYIGFDVGQKSDRLGFTKQIKWN